MGFHRCGAAISTAASKAKTPSAVADNGGLNASSDRPDVLLTRDFLRFYLSFLRRDLHDRPAVGLVVLAADPETVQQHRQFSGDGHHRSFLAAFTSTLAEL
jgi:hypothetical protein